MVDNVGKAPRLSEFPITSACKEGQEDHVKAMSGDTEVEVLQRQGQEQSTMHQGARCHAKGLGGQAGSILAHTLITTGPGLGMLQICDAFYLL